MKRILRILLALLISTSIVYADTKETKTTTVNLEVTQTYTWTVPTNISFTENGQIITESISVSENIIPKNTKLCIRLSSDQTFVLNNTGGSDTRSFAIKKDGTNLNAGDTVLEVNAGTQTGNQSLDFVLDSADVKYSGNYTNTVTFVAAVESALITFTIDESKFGGLSNASYQASEGMTWEEWVNSEYNTEGYVKYRTGVSSTGQSDGFVYYDYEYGTVHLSDKIEAGHTYLVAADIGGN